MALGGIICRQNTSKGGEIMSAADELTKHRIMESKEWETVSNSLTRLVLREATVAKVPNEGAVEALSAPLNEAFAELLNEIRKK